MKRGFTIFLLALFLLNVLGYYGIFLGLQFKTEQDMKALFDQEEALPQQEITIKVPLTVPYATDSREYTRVDGEFEYQGQTYRMVKQRVTSEALYIVCVKDTKSDNIKQALADYVKTFTDKPVNEKGSSKTIQNFIKDYIATSTSLHTSTAGWDNTISYSSLFDQFESLSIQLNSPPPRG